MKKPAKQPGKPKKRTWRKLVAPIAVAGLFFMVGFFKTHHLPKIKSWALIEIEQLTRRHSPIRVWPEKMEFTLWPIGVKFQRVRLLPKDELKDLMTPTTIDEVSASLSLLSLIQGKIRIGNLTVNKSEVKFFIRKLDKSAPKKNLLLNWDLIHDLPINEFTIKDVDFYVRDYNTGFSAFIDDLDLVVSNEYKAITVDFDSKNVNLKKTGTKPMLDLALQTQFLLEENGIYFSGFKVARRESFIVAAGAINGNTTQFDFNKLNFKTRSHLRLEELKLLANELFPKIKLPVITGQSQLDLEVSGERGQHPNFKFKINTQDAFVDGFEVGNIEGAGQFLKRRAQVKKLTVSHSGGHASISDFDLTVGKETKFKTLVGAHEVDLNKLLAGLKIPGVPVYSKINGKIPCQGTFYPKFSMKCTGSATVDELRVTGGSEVKKKPFSIVDLKGAEITGDVRIDDKSVKYKAKLKIGDSIGASDGEINFKKGFLLNYETAQLDFKNITNLAQLKLEGKVKLKGTTRGTSKWATINMNVTGQDLWLEDFGLGQSQFKLNYKKGILGFRNIRGRQESSRYNGEVAINIPRDRLFIDMEAPFIDIEEMLPLFSRHMTSPFELTGTGAARAKIRGPFDIKRLTFEFESSLYRGSVAGETFDQAIFNLDSKDGHIKTREALLTKSRSRVEMRGQLSPKGMLKSSIAGKNIRLEQSESLSRLKLQVFGQIDFNMNLSGHLSDLTTEMKGKFSKMVVGDDPAADSKFSLKLNKSVFQGSASWINDAVKTKFSYPFKEGLPLQFDMKTNNWDFTRAFAMFSGNPTQAAFQTKLTSELKFSSDSGKLLDGLGQFSVNDFEIRRGPVYMKTKEPMILSYYQGGFQTKNFSVHGPGTFLELKTPKAKPRKLNLELNGKVDMSLTSLIAPFLEDIRGDLSASLKVEGSLLKPLLLGSAYIQNGTIRVQKFPHPIEKLSADILFSQQSILLNSLKGRIGGGDLSAGGSVQFKGLNEIPVRLSGQIRKASLNVPTGFTTTGSGSFGISGDWFPYKLSADYSIQKGKIVRVITGGGTGSRQIQPSSFLPKFLLKDSFDPIHTDVNVKIVNPIPVSISMSAVNLDIDTPISGQLRVYGPPSEPRLKGRLLTGAEGRVTFRSNIFEIRTGQIDYNNSKPENPNLLVSADTRVETYDIDINLVIQGAASSPAINLTSQPPLEEHKLVSLLTLGVITGENDITGDEKYEVGTGTLIDQMGLGQELKEKLGLEVDITSTLSVGDDSDDSEMEHKVTIKKQWTPKFGASFSRSFGTRQKDNLRVEYKLNRGLSIVGRGSQEEGAEASAETENELGLDLEYKREFK